VIDGLQQLNVRHGRTEHVGDRRAVDRSFTTRSPAAAIRSRSHRTPILRRSSICLRASNPPIFGQEPTSVINTLPNLLAPGDALGDPTHGIPPTGMLSVGAELGLLRHGHASADHRRSARRT
jgi:hypothetical protein